MLRLLPIGKGISTPRSVSGARVPRGGVAFTVGSLLLCQFVVRTHRKDFLEFFVSFILEVGTDWNEIKKALYLPKKN
jgi:hypothetical protein